jgi:hypothetical protein
LKCRLEADYRILYSDARPIILGGVLKKIKRGTWGARFQIRLWFYLGGHGRIVTVEQTGNITYGYLGAAAGMSHDWMNFGSAFNHFFKHGFNDWDNESADQALFVLGINWYNAGVME